MSNETASIDLDSLLDVTLDDLADMPEFKPYPPGAHKVLFSYEKKEHKYDTGMVSGAINFNFKYVECLELADGVDATLTPKPNDTAGIYCILKNKDGSKNEFSEGTIKMFATALKERYSAGSVGAIFDAAKDSEIAIVTTLKTDKKNSTERMGVTSVSVI